MQQLCRQHCLLQQVSAARAGRCSQLEEEIARLRESAGSNRARIAMLKLELEQCVAAMRDQEGADTGGQQVNDLVCWRYIGLHCIFISSRVSNWFVAGCSLSLQQPAPQTTRGQERC